MKQQFYSWVYIQKKQKHLFKKIHAPQYSHQCYLHLPKYESNLSVHQQVNEERCDAYIHTFHGLLQSHKKE